MTASRNLLARNWGFVVAAATLLLGCDASSERTYSIAGAETGFCVPRAIDVTPFKPSDAGVISGGFAIKGCWRGSKGAKKACIGPDELVVFSVTDKASFAGRRFVDYASDAYVREVARNSRSRGTLLSDDLIAIRDELNHSKWFVWRINDVQKFEMADGDLLMAVCTASSALPGNICDRRIVGRDYVADYSFYYSEGLPGSFDLLDKRVMKEIEALRCSKRVSAAAESRETSAKK